MKVSMGRASLAENQSSTLKPLTPPAKRQEKADASNRVMGAMPDLPASRFCQPSSTLLPTGLIRPRPVTTTRRELIRDGVCLKRRPSGGLLVLLRVVDRQLDGGDLLRLFVGNLDPELVLERHHEFDRV